MSDAKPPAQLWNLRQVACKTKKYIIANVKCRQTNSHNLILLCAKLHINLQLVMKLEIEKLLSLAIFIEQKISLISEVIDAKEYIKEENKLLSINLENSFLGYFRLNYLFATFRCKFSCGNNYWTYSRCLFLF